MVLITVYHLLLIISRIIFLILDEGDTFGVNGSLVTPEKKFSINFSKANIKTFLSLDYNPENSLIIENKYLSLKKTIEMLTFQHNYAWEVFLMDLVLLRLEKYL